MGAYCHACGQHHLDGRLTIRRFASEFAARFLRMERGLPHTVLGLYRHPGVVAREYVEGHRRRYMNPLGYFLVAATVSLLMFNVIEDAYVAEITETYRWQFEQMPASQENLQELFGEDPAAALAEKAVLIIKQFNTYLGIFISAAFALLLRLLFGGARYTFAEMLVFALFASGHMTLTLGLLMPVMVYVSLNAYFVLFAVGYIVFLAFAARDFFGRGAGNAVLTVLAFFGGYLSFFVLTGVVAAVVGFVHAVLTRGG